MVKSVTIWQSFLHLVVLWFLKMAIFDSEKHARFNNQPMHYIVRREAFLTKMTGFNFESCLILHIRWIKFGHKDLMYLCLVLLQVSKCFVPVQNFWASQKIWLHLVPLQKRLCRHRNQFYWMQIIFLSGTKCLWLPQYVNKFLVWRKMFVTATICK